MFFLATFAVKFFLPFPGKSKPATAKNAENFCKEQSSQRKPHQDAALRLKMLLSILVQNSPREGQCFQFHTGSPLASRSEKVSLLPLTISRARKTSASPCFTFEPVMVISSPLAKAIPISSKKDFGHR